MSDATLSPELVSINSLIGRVQAALRAWNKAAAPGRELLDDLLLYQNAREEVEKRSNAVVVPRSVTNRVLEDALDQLEQQNAKYARLLRLRFVEGKTMQISSQEINWTIDQVRHHQRQAIEQLAEILGLDEERCRRERVDAIESTFPPPTYTQLFGVEEIQRKLVNEILSKERSWVLALTGIGGIGKTALADSVTRIVLQHFHFHKFVWLRVDAKFLGQELRDARTSIDILANALALRIAPDAVGNVTIDERLRIVRQILKDQPHFIVIDNLETIANTALMLRQLQDWSNPSKFMLTTRIKPTGEASVYTHQTAELNQLNAAELLRQHALASGQHDLATFTNEDANRVYDVVGGNPLAIKMVVSLATTMPLPLILEDVSRGHTTEVGAMYDRIYQRAWNAISPAQRMLLRAMPVVSESGATVRHLQAASNLSDSELWPAINELVSRSLVELRGGAWDRRYGLHRLTEKFLQTNINRWEDDDEEEELAL